MYLCDFIGIFLSVMSGVINTPYNFNFPGLILSCNNCGQVESLYIGDSHCPKCGDKYEEKLEFHKYFSHDQALKRIKREIRGAKIFTGLVKESYSYDRGKKVTLRAASTGSYDKHVVDTTHGFLWITVNDGRTEESFNLATEDKSALQIKRGDLVSVLVADKRKAVYPIKEEQAKTVVLHNQLASGLVIHREGAWSQTISCDSAFQVGRIRDDLFLGLLFSTLLPLLPVGGYSFYSAVVHGGDIASTFIGLMLLISTGLFLLWTLFHVPAGLKAKKVKRKLQPCLHFLANMGLGDKNTLIKHERKKDHNNTPCHQCEAICSPQDDFCFECGSALSVYSSAVEGEPDKPTRKTVKDILREKCGELVAGWNTETKWSRLGSSPYTITSQNHIVFGQVIGKEASFYDRNTVETTTRVHKHRFQNQEFKDAIKDSSGNRHFVTKDTAYYLSQKHEQTREVGATGTVSLLDLDGRYQHIEVPSSVLRTVNKGDYVAYGFSEVTVDGMQEPKFEQFVLNLSSSRLENINSVAKLNIHERLSWFAWFLFGGFFAAVAAAGYFSLQHGMYHEPAKIGLILGGSVACVSLVSATLLLVKRMMNRSRIGKISREFSQRIEKLQRVAWHSAHLLQ